MFVNFEPGRSHHQSESAFAGYERFARYSSRQGVKLVFCLFVVVVVVVVVAVVAIVVVVVLGGTLGRTCIIGLGLVKLRSKI